MLQKVLGHLAALYLLYLLVTRYNLSYHKTIRYLQFQCLQKTLLKTAYHFLLLLIGFDTLTYQKDYDRSPTLVGHHGAMLMTSTDLNIKTFLLVLLWENLGI